MEGRASARGHRPRFALRGSAYRAPSLACRRRDIGRVAAAIVLAAVCTPAVRGGDLIEALPNELIEEMKAAHPSMRQLLNAAERRLLQENATSATNASLPSPTPLAGTSYSCVSRSEYTAIALDPLLSKESRQYTDGSFFCEGYVDYAAACDLLRPTKSCNNKYAKEMYTAFEKALSVFSCKQYSLLWTCQDCKKSYKRWLCSQVYRKYVIPDTDYIEYGEVSEGSYRCICPFPDPELDPLAKDAEADKNPPCTRICNGMPRNCEIVDGQTKPTCPRNVCGGMPGLCSQSVYLDPKSSGVDDFYKGARLEMIGKDKMTAWWADIEEYDGYTKLAMFSQWNKPFGRESDPDAVPSKGDKYRIFLEDSMRGLCRDPSNPEVRMGSPCEQQQVFMPGDATSTGPAEMPSSTNAAGGKTCLDGSPYGDGSRCAAPGGMVLPAAGDAIEGTPAPAGAGTLVWKDGWRGPQRTETEAPPYKYPMAVLPNKVTGVIEPIPLGGTRCPDTDICVKVPKRNESEPLASPFGYACCPRSGYRLEIVTGEAWHVYEPQDNANLSTGDLNYTCVYKSGSSFDTSIVPVETTPGMPTSVQATIAKSATLASGCIHNSSANSEHALDDCVLKTCTSVCYDVMRKCPVKIEFGCPNLDDFREYEVTMCNIAVPQGCVLKVEDQRNSNNVVCIDLNPTGYGPLFYNSKELEDFKKDVFENSGSKWLDDPALIYGLPIEANCVGTPPKGLVNGLSIDIGKDFRDGKGLNRPTNGPATVAGANSTYKIFCADEDEGSTLKLQAGDVGCREIKYAGYHDKDCYKNSEGNIVAKGSGATGDAGD